VRLFYHHVGQLGAAEDFPKTVFSRVPIADIEKNLGRQNPARPAILNVLKARFPSGSVNCWGVPAGAKNIIRNLAEGDVVLLVESTRFDGQVPALCKVKAFWPEEKLHALSTALWGDDKYPYIFFFDTEELDPTWEELHEHLGFRPNYDPRGQFLTVHDKRLESLGGAERYVESLRSRHRISHSAESTLSERVKQELKKLKDISVRDEPVLTEEHAKVESKSVTAPRSAAFRVGITQLYARKCAICGLSLRTPSGNPEVESAHIYPRGLGGSDDLRNGLCLCRMHHWALDKGWMSLSDAGRVIVRTDVPQTEDYDFIRNFAGVLIATPADQELRPHRIFYKRIASYTPLSNLIHELPRRVVFSETRRTRVIKSGGPFSIR
jgi:HNH endonuclease